MEREQFSDQLIASLEGRAKPYTLRCAETHGFMVRVLPSGTKTLYHEQVRGGQKVRHRIGHHPERPVEAARAICRERNIEYSERPKRSQIDAREARERHSDVVFEHTALGELAWAFLGSHVASLSAPSQAQYKALMRKVVCDYHNTSDITPVNIRQAMDTRQSTPVMANRYLAVLSVFCRWLVERGHLEFNPALSVTRYKEKPRQEVLTDDELRELGAALKATKAKRAVVLAIRVMLATGARVTETTGMRHAELRRDVYSTTGEWALTAERTKSSRNFMTFLPGSLWEELYTRGPKPIDSTSGAVRQALGRLCQAAGITKVSPHDLRRTFGTMLAQQRVNPDMRGRLLNHSAAGVTDRHYNVYDYADEKLEILQAHWQKLRDLGVLD